MLRRIIATTLLTLAIVSTWHIQAAQKAHKHGAAIIDVVIDENELLISLDSPAANLVGFEHTPSTDEQRAIVNSTLKILGKWQNIFGISNAAQCNLNTVEIETALADSHGDEHEDDHEDGAHSDFEVTWSLHCTNPAMITEIAILLFNSFKGFDEIKANIVSPRGQTAIVLYAQSNKIKL